MAGFPLDRWIDLLPQKPPFLFVDHVLELEPLRRVKGSKTFPDGDPIFENHLPGEPLVPGVIVIEALAQLGSLVLFETESARLRGYLGEVSRLRFHRRIRPGEVIQLEAELAQAYGPFARLKVRATVGEELAADGEIILARSPEARRE